MSRIAILASGAGTTAEAVIAACIDGEVPAEVVIVVSNNSNSGALSRAASYGVTTRHLSGRTHHTPEDLDAAMLETLDGVAATHIVLAGYMKKLGPRTLQSFRGRTINTHPALLPSFGGQGMFGRHVHEAVLSSGATVTGATVHHVDDGYDTGAIVAQVEVKVRPDDTVDSLAERVQYAERKLLVRTLSQLLGGPPTA